MKSTSSALTPRKIAEFCKGRFTTIFTAGEVRLLYSCLVDLLERAEYPPYRGSGLDLQSLSAMLDINVERLRAHRAHLQPIFDAGCNQTDQDADQQGRAHAENQLPLNTASPQLHGAPPKNKWPKQCNSRADCIQPYRQFTLWLCSQ